MFFSSILQASAANSERPARGLEPRHRTPNQGGVLNTCVVFNWTRTEHALQGTAPCGKVVKKAGGGAGLSLRKCAKAGRCRVRDGEGKDSPGTRLTLHGTRLAIRLSGHDVVFQFRNGS